MYFTGLQSVIVYLHDICCKFRRAMIYLLGLTASNIFLHLVLVNDVVCLFFQLLWVINVETIRWMVLIVAVVLSG